jgi:hypothetical protein
MPHAHGTPPPPADRSSRRDPSTPEINPTDRLLALAALAAISQLLLAGLTLLLLALLVPAPGLLPYVRLPAGLAAFIEIVMSTEIRVWAAGGGRLPRSGDH